MPILLFHMLLLIGVYLRAYYSIDKDLFISTFIFSYIISRLNPIYTFWSISYQIFHDLLETIALKELITSRYNIKSNKHS